MNQEMLERVLRCPSLPTLPAVAVRVIELTHNPDVALDDLARTIQNDQGLSAKILKTVNSSFYGLRRPCSTINQALVLLGLSTVKSLVLSFSLLGAIKTPAGSKFDLRGYWRRALFSAVAAKHIARAGGVLEEDEAFLAGLLQDIGVMAFYNALGDEYLKIVDDTQGDHRALVAFELDHLGVQHAAIGAMLAQRWKLPDDLVVPVRFHEQPTAAPSEYTDLVRCVGLGAIAHDVLTDADPGLALGRFEARAKEWFGLDVTASDQLVRSIAAATRELAPLFKVETGPYPDADAIIAKAREQLTDLASSPQPITGGPFAGIVSDGDQRDPLTGALRREAMLLRADEAFDAARETGQSVAALEIAIDNFGLIVSSGGTEAGDALLVEVARLLTAHFPGDRAMVARSGIGAFSILAPGLDPVGVVRAASDIRGKLAAQSTHWKIPALQGRPLTASIGTAATGSGPSQYARVQQLFVAARRAMESAAAEGGNNTKAFVPRKAA